MKLEILNQIFLQVHIVDSKDIVDPIDWEEAVVLLDLDLTIVALVGDIVCTENHYYLAAILLKEFNYKKLFKIFNLQ